MERINYDSVQEVRMYYTQMGLIGVIGVQRNQSIKNLLMIERKNIRELTIWGYMKTWMEKYYM